MHNNCIIDWSEITATVTALLYSSSSKQTVKSFAWALFSGSMGGVGNRVGGSCTWETNFSTWWILLNNIAVMGTNSELLLSSRGFNEHPPLVCFPIWTLSATYILPLRLFSEKFSCLIYWICFSMFAYLLSGDAVLRKLCRVLFFSDIRRERLIGDCAWQLSRQRSRHQCHSASSADWDLGMCHRQNITALWS